MDGMDTIVLSIYNACYIIQLLCHRLSPPHCPLRLPSDEQLSSLDQGYMFDQVIGSL